MLWSEWKVRLEPDGMDRKGMEKDQGIEIVEEEKREVMWSGLGEETKAG